MFYYYHYHLREKNISKDYGNTTEEKTTANCDHVYPLVLMPHKLLFAVRADNI